MFTCEGYTVTFKHFLRKRYTLCNVSIVFEKKHTTMAIGRSDCSTKDNFSRNTGRKISLGRALAQLFPNDKETRKKFWKQYFSTVRHGDKILKHF